MMIKRFIMKLLRNNGELRTFTNRYASTPVARGQYAHCDCFEDGCNEKELDKSRSVDDKVILFHRDPPHESQRAWDILLEIIEHAKCRHLKRLNIGELMDRDDFMKLNTLPKQIGELSDLEELIIYGSNMSYIPRELSNCKKLKVFEPYTSYRLHWYPYEIKECSALRRTCISTRALYGNYKYRPGFPDLKVGGWVWPENNNLCSICGRETEQMRQYWISKIIGTDVVPLLMSTCGKSCRVSAGIGHDGYIMNAHQGGLTIVQPGME